MLGNDRKYELIESEKEIDGKVLHRIRALKTFGDVKKGDIGGWIESEQNLSHEGTCWVYDDAIVYENANVSDNAKVKGTTVVFGNAKIYENAMVFGIALVFGDAEICGNAMVFDNARVLENAIVKENAKVYENANIYDYANIYGNAQVYGNAKIFDEVKIYGSACIYGYSWIQDHVEVYENARVYENANIYDYANIYGNAQVYGQARIYGRVDIYGNAKIYDYQVIEFGSVDHDILSEKDWNTALYTLFRVYPVNGKIILYMSVRENYSMLEYPEVIIEPGKIIDAKDCKNDLYFSYPDNIRPYVKITQDEVRSKWYDKYFIVAAEIDVKDIISIRNSEVYVKQARIIDVVDPLK